MFELSTSGRVARRRRFTAGFATLALLGVLAPPIPLQGGATIVPALAPPAGPVQETQEHSPATESVKILNDQRVYYPEPVKSSDSFKKPAVVKSRSVYDKIPEYKAIKDRNLDRDKGAEYWLLLKRATEKFLRAIAKMAQAESYDIVAEPGAIELKGKSIPDATQRVIQYI